MAIGLIVDGRNYNVHVVPDSVKRIAELLEGPLADDMLSGRRERDLKGTRIGYQLHIEPVWTDPTDYDALFDALMTAYVTAKNEARAKFTPKSVKAAAEKK